MKTFHPIVGIRLLVLVLASMSATAEDRARVALARGEDAAAFELYLRRAELGDPIAQNNVGVLYLKGRGTPVNLAEARRWFEAAAGEGLPGGMHNLGVMYLRGHGMPPDPVAAAEWLRKAAELGDADAQFYLARLYYRGEGVPADLTVAREWFIRAADQGLPSARFNAALMLLRGQGGAPDEVRALDYLNLLEAENEEAQLLIAQVHLLHAAEPARAALAQAGFRRLADKGNPEAQFHLGMMMMLGQGGGRDYEEGRFWLEQASRTGLALAQINLAGLYERGLGVSSSPVEAAAWYTLALQNGEESARSPLEALKEDFEEDERVEVNTRIADLRARHPDVVHAPEAAPEPSSSVAPQATPSLPP